MPDPGHDAEGLACLHPETILKTAFTICNHGKGLLHDPARSFLTFGVQTQNGPAVQVVGSVQPGRLQIILPCMRLVKDSLHGHYTLIGSPCQYLLSAPRKYYRTERGRGERGSHNGDYRH